ncbi:hypothetical protein BGZ93_008259, partial [Podila epicladia]
MSYFTTTTTENLYYYDNDNYIRKSLKTWRDHLISGVTALAWVCGTLIVCALGLMFIALGVALFLAMFVAFVAYQSLPSTDDYYWIGVKVFMWASGSAILVTLNLVLLASVTSAFLVMMWGQLMECLTKGGTLFSNFAGKESEYMMGAGGFVSTFNATIYDRQVRIETLRIAQSMLLLGTLGGFLMMPLCYK